MQRIKALGLEVTLAWRSEITALSHRCSVCVQLLLTLSSLGGTRSCVMSSKYDNIILCGFKES